MDRVNSVAELIERTKDMPLERMRFFIGEDRREARCFGIYQDAGSGNWVVYKNKSDGSRAVRYNGPDEAYAAQELWTKINSEVYLRRAKLPSRREKTRGEIIRERVRNIALGLLIAVGLVMVVRWYVRQPHRGYYLIDDGIYYYQDSGWYYYDDGDWDVYYGPDDYDWYADHYYGTSYSGFDDYNDRFEYSSYYVEPSDDDDDDDSSIFDSWDIGDTDWDSDW